MKFLETLESERCQNQVANCYIFHLPSQRKRYDFLVDLWVSGIKYTTAEYADIFEGCQRKKNSGWDASCSASETY